MRLVILAVSAMSLPICAGADVPPPATPPKPQLAKDGGASKASTKRLSAVLLGKEISAESATELSVTITGTLFRRYIEEMKIVATDAEIDAYLAVAEQSHRRRVEEWKRRISTLEKELQSPLIGEVDRDQKEVELDVYKQYVAGAADAAKRRDENPEKYRNTARTETQSTVIGWNFSHSLFKKYGGRLIFQHGGLDGAVDKYIRRLIFQHGGPVPIDAYRDFLKEREKAGDFKIEDEAVKEEFWEYFVNDKLHRFYPEGDTWKWMKMPWWLEERK